MNDEGERQGELFLHNTQEVIRDAKGWYEELRKSLFKEVKKYEEGIENSPLKENKDFAYPFIPIPSIRKSLDSDKEPNLGYFVVGMSVSFADDMSNSETYFNETSFYTPLRGEKDGVLDDLLDVVGAIQGKNSGDKAAYLDSENGRIGFMFMPKRVFERKNVQNTTTEHIEEFSRYLKRYSEVSKRKNLDYNNEEEFLESFKSTVRHELTHLYLYNSAKHSSSLHKRSFSMSTSIHEGAARVVSYITSGEETPLSGYREKGVNAEDLQTVEYILHKFARELIDDGATKREAISEVREKAAEAYRNMVERPNNDVISAFREDNEELKNLRSIFRKLDKADMHTWNILDLYGMQPEEKNRHLKRGPENQLYSDILLELSAVENDILKGSIDRSKKNKSAFAKAKRKVESRGESIEAEFSRDSAMNMFLEIRKELISLKEDLESLEGQDQNLANEVENEVEYIEKIVEDLSNFLEEYNQDKKLQKIASEQLESMNSELDFEEVHDMYEDELFLSSKRLLNAEEDMEQRLTHVIESYKVFIDSGIQLNGRLLKVCEEIHGDAEKIAKHVNEEENAVESEYSIDAKGIPRIIQEFEKDLQKEYRKLKKAFQISSEIHKVAENADENLKKARSILESAEDDIEQLKVENKT